MIEAMRALQDWLRRNNLPPDGVALVIATRDEIVKSRVAMQIGRDLSEMTADGRPVREADQGTLMGAPFCVIVASPDGLPLRQYWPEGAGGFAPSRDAPCYKGPACRPL